MLFNPDRRLYCVSGKHADSSCRGDVSDGINDKSNDGIFPDNLGILSSDRVGYDICNVVLMNDLDYRNVKVKAAILLITIPCGLYGLVNMLHI